MRILFTSDLKSFQVTWDKTLQFCLEVTHSGTVWVILMHVVYRVPEQSLELLAIEELSPSWASFGAGKRVDISTLQVGSTGCCTGGSLIEVR